MCSVQVLGVDASSSSSNGHAPEPVESNSSFDHPEGAIEKKEDELSFSDLNYTPTLDGKISVTSAAQKIKKHKRFYMPQGNIIIQVENTLFKLSLSVLHENSPVLRVTVPPLQSGKTVPVVGLNDKQPLMLREISEVAFVRLLSFLYPQPSKPPKKFNTIEAYLSVLKLANVFQMDLVRNAAMIHLQEMPIDPIRKIAIWDEFHLDADLLLPEYAVLCQRSEPLNLAMTMSLGIRNFTKVAASRDLYRQRVGCLGCRKTLSIKESQAIANEVVAAVFAKKPPSGKK